MAFAYFNSRLSQDLRTNDYGAYYGCGRRHYYGYEVAPKIEMPVCEWLSSLHSVYHFVYERRSFSWAAR